MADKKISELDAGGTPQNADAVPIARAGSNFSLAMSDIKAYATAGIAAGGIAISAGAGLASTGTVSFADSNGITFGLNGQTLTATVKTDYLTTARASNDAVGLNTALTAGPLAWTVNSNGISLNAGSAAGTTSGFAGNNISGSMTHNTAGLNLSLNHPAWLTTAAVSNHSHGFSAAGGSSAFQTLVFTNSNGVSFTNTGGSVAASVVTTYAGQGFTSAGANIGLSGTLSTNGLSLSATVPSQTNQTLGLYAVSNTTGQSSSSTFDARTISFQGAGIASVGYSGGSVVISVPSGGGAGDGVNILAAGTQTANTTGSVLFQDSNGVTFGMNNSSRITATVATNYAASNHSHGNPTLNLTNLSGTTASNSAGFTLSLSAAAGGAAPARSYIEVMQGERLTAAASLSATAISNRPLIMPFWFDGAGIELKTVRFLVSGQSSSNRSFGGTFSAGVYSAVNSSQLTLLGSETMSFSYSASSQGSLWNGMNIMDFTAMSAVTLSNEGRYAMAFAVAPVSANITWMSAALWGGDPFPAVSRFMIANTTSATNNTSNIFPFWGAYSTTTNALPNSIAATQINGGNSASLVDAYAILKEI